MHIFMKIIPEMIHSESAIRRAREREREMRTVACARIRMSWCLWKQIYANIMCHVYFSACFALWYLLAFTCAVCRRRRRHRATFGCKSISQEFPRNSSLDSDSEASDCRSSLDKMDPMRLACVNVWVCVCQFKHFHLFFNCFCSTLQTFGMPMANPPRDRKTNMCYNWFSF